MLGLSPLFTVIDGQISEAQPPSNSTFRDEATGVIFVDETKQQQATFANQNSLVRLSDTKDSKGGESAANTKTIRQILGPDLQSITVIYVAPVETCERFSLARDAFSDALQKSPTTIYRYEPWANAVHPEFIGRINYSDGKTGDLALSYGYLCFQDHQGKHWWARFTMPSDLNLEKIDGVLGFEAGNGYFLEKAGGHRIWLRPSENKLLVRQLQELLNKPVVVTGELRRIPKNVVTSIPSGADYFAYGFTIAPATK
jgi:hypothetical protein